MRTLTGAGAGLGWAGGAAAAAGGGGGAAGWGGVGGGAGGAGGAGGGGWGRGGGGGREGRGQEQEADQRVARVPGSVRSVQATPPAARRSGAGRAAIVPPGRPAGNARAVRRGAARPGRAAALL